MTRLVGIGALGLIAIAVLAFTPPPAGPVAGEAPTSARDAAVEAYVSEHLSELSPSGEVLGGTFYVTEVHAEDGRGTVSYEDGHVAHSADFTYEHAEGGNISITSFVIKE